MSAAPYRFVESERLGLVEELELAGTVNEPALAALATAAATICGAPISLVTVLDEDTQWFVAQVGIDSNSTPREQAFCDVAIRHPDSLLEVPDTLRDSRFSSNPLVTASPHIRFYAGVPIRPLDHHAIGTLCIISDTPRELGDSERAALRGLGSVAEQLFRLRLRARAEERLRRSTVLGLAHDLSAPLASIRVTAESLASQEIGGPAQRQIEKLTVFAAGAEALVADLRSVDQSVGDSVLRRRQPVHLGALADDVILATGADERVTWDLHPVWCQVDQRVVVRALANLVNNALIHTASSTPITVLSRIEDDDLILLVEDHGDGLPDEVDQHIREFGRTDDIPAAPGLGLGLIVAHSLVRTHNGVLTVETGATGTRIALTLPGVVTLPVGAESPDNPI